MGSATQDFALTDYNINLDSDQDLAKIPAGETIWVLDPDQQGPPAKVIP